MPPPGRPVRGPRKTFVLGAGCLSADRMTQLKQAFACRGVRAASVFLMRDPVDRIWSQIRRLPDQDLLQLWTSSRFVL